MRILVFSNVGNDSPGRERLRAIAGPECEVVLATAAGTAGFDGPIALCPIPVNDPGAPAERLRWNTGALRRLLAERQPDLVYIEAEADSQLAAAGSRLCRKLRLPYVLFSWQSLATRRGFWARRRADRVLRAAAGVQGGNALAMDLLHQGAPGALAAAIPNGGVSLPAAVARVGSAELVIGFAGRLSPERGADLLIEALSRTFGKWRLVIVGTGPEQESLESAIGRLGLAARVRWAGPPRRETLEQFWREIDCLVVPSRDTKTWVDGHSPVLLEAMSHGIAPIVTRAGALAEFVAHVGVVVPDGAALTEALQRWVAEPGKCRAAGAAARQLVLDRYVTSAVAERTLAFWRAVRDQAGPASVP